MTRTLFTIRNKHTGAFMPQKKGCGYTQVDYWSPNDIPRLLKTRHAAKIALSYYLKGKWAACYSSGDYWGPGGEYTGNAPTPAARNPADYEVVEVELRWSAR